MDYAPTQISQPKDAGLRDQLITIVGRLHELGSNLDGIAERVIGPTPQAIPEIQDNAPPQANIAMAMRMIREHLGRAEMAMHRIAGAL